METFYTYEPARRRRQNLTVNAGGKSIMDNGYTYDANGNLVYVNTGRIRQDGALDSTAAERKLRWDEENRLTASDDNV